MVEPLLVILIVLLLAFLIVDRRSGIGLASGGVLHVVIVILVIALFLRLLGII